MSTRTDEYRYAYVNSVASRLARAKGEVSASLQRLADAGYIRRMAFPEALRTRGRRPKEVFLPQPRLNSHFDLASSTSAGTSTTHMFLVSCAVDFLARQCGAYVDACHHTAPKHAQIAEEVMKRSPDAFAIFRRDEFSWDVTRPFSIEGETMTSLDNNKWTKQVSINARKNFLLGFRANIFVCFDFDIDKMRRIVDELPEELARRTFCLVVDCDTDSVSWAIPIPLRRKTVDTEALGWV